MDNNSTGASQRSPSTPHPVSPGSMAPLLPCTKPHCRCSANWSWRRSLWGKNFERTRNLVSAFVNSATLDGYDAQDQNDAIDEAKPEPLLYPFGARGPSTLDEWAASRGVALRHSWQEYVSMNVDKMDAQKKLFEELAGGASGR